nr:hypothetical protein [Angustibacter aerolatus]
MSDVQRWADPTDPTAREFGEEGARLTYGSYLRVEQAARPAAARDGRPRRACSSSRSTRPTSLWFKQAAARPGGGP